jgi:hypothetical protein
MAIDPQNSFSVSVKVSPALKAYLLAVNGGSDLIIPAKESRLWGLVKMHIELLPGNYQPRKASDEEENYIRIALFRYGMPTYNADHDKVQWIDTLWRNHLSPSGQQVIADYLMRNFKQQFRAYVTGALANNQSLSIHDAIFSFCERHSVNMDKITYEMLRKDWYRFRLRNKDQNVVPMTPKDF